MYASEGKRGRARSIEGIVKRGRTNRQTDSKRGFLHGKSLDTTLVSVVLCIRFLFHGSFYNCRILSASRTLKSHSNFKRFYTIALTNYFSLPLTFGQVESIGRSILSQHPSLSLCTASASWHFMVSKVENTMKTIFLLSGKLLMLVCDLRGVPN